MRSGYFKERYSELIVLTDSPAVKAWTGVLLVALVAAPMLLSGYAYAIGVTRLGLPPELALVLSAVVPAVFGLIVGIPSLRLHGLYLAITTLAFSYIVSASILGGGSFTGGGRGIQIDRPTLLGVDLSSDRAFYWFCLLMAVLAMLATLNFRRSYIGRALVA